MFGADSDSANLLLGNKVGTLSRVAASSEPPDERRTFSLPGYVYSLTPGGLISLPLVFQTSLSAIASPLHLVVGRPSLLPGAPPFPCLSRLLNSHGPMSPGSLHSLRRYLLPPAPIDSSIQSRHLPHRSPETTRTAHFAFSTVEVAGNSREKNGISGVEDGDSDRLGATCQGKSILHFDGIGEVGLRVESPCSQNDRYPVGFGISRKFGKRRDSKHLSSNFHNENGHLSETKFFC